MKGRLVFLGLAAAICANAYTWDYTSANPWYGTGPWSSNGAVEGVYPNGFGMAFPGGGSYIYTPTVSGANSNDYAIESTLYVSGWVADTFIHFMRAGSTSVLSGVGSYVSAELVTSAPGASTLYINQCVNGRITLLGSAQVTVTSTTTFQTVIFGTNLWVFVNGTIVMQQTLPSATTGRPGIGGSVGDPDDGYADGFTSVQIGPHWTTPPAAVSSTGFSSMAYPTTVAMKWQAVSPGNDPGILDYAIQRNAVASGVTVFNNPPEFQDATVTPATAYIYTIQTVDIHGNISAGTNFTITTPPSGTGPGAPPNSFNPTRVGLQTTGSYWGGGGEQIDTMSGNLNFSFPLLKAQGRNGWAVPVNLVYNSQNWQQGNGVNWQLGYDVGFGFGWKMLIGSITPNYATQSGGVTSYTFTDNTGAQYLLNQNNGGIWSSQQGIYVWFDANTDKLHFKDGTFWVMGSVSGGNEADAGTMYPTIVEDVNGNQVIVTYDVGVGMSTGNTSARILTIEDVRAVNTNLYNLQTGYYFSSGRYTYWFTYDGATPVSHLYGFANTIGTSESGGFTYSTGVELSPPFGADPAWYGKTTSQLASYQVGSWVASRALGTYQFTYDPAGAQELMQVTFPWGGHLAWNYASFAYAGGRSLREVSTRYLAADSAGANTWTYAITRPDAANSVQVHSGMTLADASGNGAKTWSFLTTTTASASWQVGLASDFRQLATTGSTNAITHDKYTWAQDPAGNPYISSKTSLTDENTANQQSALSTQTLDQYGNVTQSVIYPYNNTSAALKTYANTYLNDSGTYWYTGSAATYIEAYIRNRLVTSTLTTGGANITLAQNTYDGATPANVSGTFHELDASPVLPWYQRGWMTQSVTPAKTTSIGYYSPGGALTGTSATDGSTTSVSADASTNYAAPVTMSTQSYSQTVGYNSWLGVTQTTGANGEQLYVAYDGSGRPTSGTSPMGRSRRTRIRHSVRFPCSRRRPGRTG